MRENRSSYVDRVLDEALATVAGIDLDQTKDALRFTSAAILKQAKALAKVNYEQHEARAVCNTCKTVKMHTIEAPNPDNVARAMRNCANVLDDVTRLREFAQGHADSRPQADWVKLLTPEQLQTLRGWIEGKD